MVDLHRMRQLMRQTVNVQWKIEREMARATKITTVITGMPHGGGGHDQVADGAIQLQEIKAVYNEALDELERMRSELDPLVNTLEDVNLRAAMRLRYMHGRSPEDIADAISYADRTIYRFLRKGEEELCRRYPEKVIRGRIPESCQ